MHKGKPKMVIFDWDHTLVSAPIPPNPDDVASLRRHYASEAIGMSQADLDAFDHEELGFSLPIRSYPPDFNQFKTKNSDKMLEYLSGSGVLMGVVSNKSAIVLKLEAKLIGWEHYFCCLFGKGMGMPIKPSPQMLWAAAQAGGMKYGDLIWFVGDSSLDTRAAASAGFVSVHYNYTHGADAIVVALKNEYGWLREIGDGEAGADYVIDDLNDLAKMFANS